MRIVLLIMLCVIYSKAYARDAQGGIIQRAEEFYKKGKNYSLKGQYNKADEEFKKADKLLSERAGKEKGLPRVVKKTRKVPTLPAVNKVENSASKSSARRVAGFRKNNNAFYDVSNSIKGYLKLLYIMPDNPDIHYDLGIEYLKRRDYFDASREFKKVVKLNPDDKDAYYNLGILCESFLNDKRMAVVYYREYLKLAPKARDSKAVKGWIDSLRNKSR